MLNRVVKGANLFCFKISSLLFQAVDLCMIITFKDLVNEKEL